MDANEYEFTDTVLVCVDCGRSFIFTAGEQAYYASKFLITTKRCQSCRDLRKKTLAISLEARK